jgi:hypothetical protein
MGTEAPYSCRAYLHHRTDDAFVFVAERDGAYVASLRCVMPPEAVDEETTQQLVRVGRVKVAMIAEAVEWKPSLAPPPEWRLSSQKPE